MVIRSHSIILDVGGAWLAAVMTILVMDRVVATNVLE